MLKSCINWEDLQVWELLLLWFVPKSDMFYITISHLTHF